MKYTLLILSVFAAGLAWGQSGWLENTHVGIAVEDVENTSLLNMAAIGVGNASGMGLSGYWREKSFTFNNFHFVGGPFAYNFRSSPGNGDYISDHELGFGARIYRGIYAGTSFRWNSSKDFGWNIHTLFRPARWLSLAVNANSLTSRQPFSLGLGAGLNPFFFEEYLSTRLILFYDGEVSPGGASYRNTAVGLRSSIIDGLNINGHWDFRSGNFVVEVKLSWGHLLMGAGTPVAGDTPWKNPTTEVFVSVKELPSLPITAKPKLMIYDLAQVITDTPVSSSMLSKMLIGDNKLPIYDFLVHMDELSSMRDVDAVLFKNQNFETSFSNLHEITMAIRRVGENKKIYFYSDSYDPLQYALAAGVADEIIINPHGHLSVQGFARTRLYFKSLLAKYGVSFYNFQSHEYKASLNSLSESSMTDAERESLEYVYEAFQYEMDSMIREGRRGKLDEKLEDIYEKGFWMSADQAWQAKLVDSKMYPDELEEMIGREYLSFHVSSNRSIPTRRNWEATLSPIVAIIYANGYIHQGEGIRGRSIGAESLKEAIRTARKNPLVRAIVLRVNSGGGSALASNLIAREVALCVNGEKNARPKPIVISMAGMAASGGYLISSPGTKIFATPVSISGSIGVISIMPNLSGLLEHFEIGADTVAMTKSADFPNFFRPLNETELAHISSLIMEEYDDFVSTVATGRNSEKESIDEVAQGRIWSGKQARERGLVDELGGLTEAIEAARELANIRGNAQIVEINPGAPPRQSILKAALGIQEESPLNRLPQDLADIIDFYKILARLEGEQVLYLMPYVQEP